ncbi:hypothetical protein V5799_010619 [Amblyomma americanum]|uniref:Uncharacterized protein n=1 Tax=Amblyomma americanum TaxID=6943 RepID=A0AAQ4EJJ8_AMBAM
MRPPRNYRERELSSDSSSSKRPRQDTDASAKNYHKRKASCGASPRDSSKRPRLDIDIFDSKIKKAKEVKERNMKKARDTLRSYLHRIRRAMTRRERKRGSSEVDSDSPPRKHGRADTAPPPHQRYLRMRERRVRTDFKHSERSIREAYRATKEKLVAAKDEVLRFNGFYSGLQDRDPRLLTDGQVEDYRKTEKMLKYFKTFYRVA